MTLPCISAALSVLAMFSLSTLSAYAAAPSPETIVLWPKGAPDETGGIGLEHDTSKPGEGMTGGKSVIRLSDVTAPTLTIYRPAKSIDTGCAVIVCPGGGYGILAYDLEGTEICDYLNSVGVTAALLKYRVPARQGRPRYAAPLQDAQRAMGILRSRAAEWNLRPDRMGILGFSAGGHLSAALSTNYVSRTYGAIDAADRVSCRPDFAVLVYPAYLTAPDGSSHLAPELPVTTDTPPTFLVQTEDDPIHVENSVTYFLALKNARVPAELHVYPAGGHGYGMRKASAPVSMSWPDLVTAWLTSRGLLTHAK
jgi:acetyl esterase/lipase